MSKIINVEPFEDFRLSVTFKDGVVKVFDALPFLDSASMSSLRDKEYFGSIEVGYHGDKVVWREGEEFTADMIYVRGEAI